MVGITESMRRAGFGIWLDREVHGFLYGDRPNPFNDVYGFLEYSEVGTWGDAFEPEYEQPRMDLILLHIGDLFSSYS